MPIKIIASGDVVGPIALTGDATVGDVVSPKTFYAEDSGTKMTGTLIKNPTVDPLILNPNVVMYPMEVAWLTYKENLWPTGDLSNLPLDIKNIYATFGITGDLEDIPDGVLTVHIESSAITGDLADIPDSVTHLGLYNCVDITGDLADLSSNLTFIIVSSDPLISGVYTPGVNINTLILSDTGMSPADTDATIIALDASGAPFGMAAFCPNRTASSSAACASLIAKGWMLMAEMP